MSQVKRNIAANFVSRIWAAVLSLAVVPVYIKFLGIEAYGLVGFFVSLLGLFSILDFGLGATANREIAKLSAIPGGEREMRDLVRTLEIVYWVMALFIGAAVILLAPTIAQHWLTADSQSQPEIIDAVELMGLAIAVQWPISLYSNGLFGLQQQVALNVINIAFATARNLGAVLILYLLAPTVHAFFAWQIIANVGQTITIRLMLSRNLPKVEGTDRFRTGMLRTFWRFSAGVSCTSMLQVILSSLDKMILSKLLSLEWFGYYTLASTAANTVFHFTVPVSNSVSPKFVQLYTCADEKALARLYHQASQLISIAVLPLTMILVFFSEDLILVWTGNPEISRNTHLILSILAVAASANSLLNLPYTLQLAAGWVRLNFYQNLISVTVLVPLLYWSTSRYGLVGAASSLVAVNVAFFAVVPQVMHRRLLNGEQRQWYLADIGLPLLAAFGITALGSWVLPELSSRVYTLMGVISVLLISILGAIFVLPMARAFLLQTILKTWRRRPAQNPFQK